MNITYDSAKDARNFTKHGVSLQLANLLEWAALYAKADSRVDYGELRTSVMHLLVIACIAWCLLIVMTVAALSA